MDYLLNWIEHHPGTASWVQGVGSILAIGAAIWIASRQSAAAQESRRMELVDRLEAVEKMLTTCRDRTNDLYQELVVLPAKEGRKYPTLVSVNALRVSLQVVTAIAPVQAPTAMAVEALIVAQTAIANGMGVIPSRTREFPVTWEDGFRELNTSIGAAAEMLGAEINRVKNSY
ncbi:hypothetical protein [Paraburkholderia agricolaris]|uniref:hypothetical protein n=1 Tax=Paraburkholderia agricolaris TaxID=2152888 RepID=UPI0012908B9A|nr:hypothetical protein [Paraburkholderia agricolaris]